MDVVGLYAYRGINVNAPKHIWWTEKISDSLEKYCMLNV